MRIFGALILLAALAAPALARGAQVERAGQDDESLYKLPEGFFIGAGTSALQTEGAWNENGKAESQADHLFHIDKLGLAGSHDVSSDSYHRFKEDVAMAKAIGLQVYRLSLSWSRLLPTGKASEYNPDGLRFYKEFIQEIVDNDMEPFITLYHFDHPQSLQKEFLGWEDRKMIDYFVEYADFAFKSFGDKVKYWTTANEPNFYCLYFSSLMRVAGEATKEQLNANRCMQNFVLAHMRAYHVYKNKYFASQKGYVGTSAVIFHAKPATTTPEDIYAAEAFNNLHVGQVLHPVIFGDYPPVLKKVAKSNGRELIEYTDEERKLLTDSADFIGINVYNGNVASYTNKTETSGEQFGPGNILDDLLEDYKFIQLGGVGGDFAKIDSESMSRAVSWIWQQYGKPIVITENGYGDESAVGLHDHSRTVYFSAYIRSLLATVNTFGMEVWGYIAWSLIDCYEWNVGFSRTFGLVHVDFEGNTLKRTLKDSTKFFTQIIKDRYVPHIEETSGSPSLTATPAIVLVALIALWRTIRPL